MLSQKDIRQFVRLAKKIDKPHEGLPKEVFQALCKVVPFAACELAIVNAKKEILLAWRDDKFWRGWHFPGGLIRFRETFEERIETTAWDELGVRIENFKFLFPINYSQIERGHSVSLVFLCKTDMNPKKGKWFKTMPKNIIEEHKEVWDKVKPYLK